MKLNIIFIVSILLCMLIIACKSKKETPQTVAKKWCELYTKMVSAPDGGPEYGKAKEAFGKYENTIAEKYLKDAAFWNEIQKEIQTCDGKSVK